MSIKTLVRFSSTQPKAVGECDRCGHIYRRIDLSPQMRYAGASIIDTGLRVCSDCLDPLDPQEKLTIPLPDGLPIHDPRPINRVWAARSDYTAKPGFVESYWAGFAPTQSNAQAPSLPGVGAATWTGPAPITTLVVPITTTASLTWTGFAPTLSLTLTITAGYGAASWSGHAPAITNFQRGMMGYGAIGQYALGQGEFS